MNVNGGRCGGANLSVQDTNERTACRRATLGTPGGGREGGWLLLEETARKAYEAMSEQNASHAFVCVCVKRLCWKRNEYRREVGGGRERGDWKSEVKWRLDSLKDVAIIKKTKSK